MIHERAYTPPPLNPLEAQFCNVLLTKDWPCGFDLFGTPCSFAVDPWQAPFVPACSLAVDVRGEVWRVLFSSVSPMELHPAGARIAEFPDLPEGLRLALFELSFAPVLQSLADLFNLDKPPAILTENSERPDEFACSVPLILRLPGEDVAVALCIPGRDAAEAILFRLRQAKYKRNPVPALRLAVALETGTMRLTVPELSALRPEDVLLPETYPGIAGELCLRLAPDLVVRCAVDGGRATVLGFVHGLVWPMEKETRRKDMADPLPDGASREKNIAPGIRVPGEQEATLGIDTPAREQSVDLDMLEVTVTFELERRLMSIAEIAALAPGYTFTLPAAPDGPVAVRANGKYLGTGRLVEVGGALGVQLFNMKRE